MIKFYVIGKKGFIATELRKKNYQSQNIEFLDHKDINQINIDSSLTYKILLLSFNRQWYSNKNYDCKIEKKIFKKFKGTDHTVLFSSTSKVYPNGLDICEDHKLSPQSIYAKNKIIAEEFIMKNFKKFNIFRLGNVFGDDSYAKNSFLDTFLINLESKKIVFDVSSSSLRDFIHVDFLQKVFFSYTQIPNGVYNLSSGVGIKIIELIRSILVGNNISEEDVEITFGNKVKSQFLSNKKLFKILNLKKIEKQDILKKLRGIKC